MKPTGWNKINRVFNAALQHDTAEREPFLNSECAGDKELRREVESLLSSLDEADSFLEAPAISEVADSFVSESGRLKEGEGFGKYRIKRLIGKGGMGEVYLAEDLKLHRDVAIKTLPMRFGFEPERLERFEFEAFAVSSLNHPNILTIHEIGEHEGIHFISTEYVEGKPLTEYYRRKDCRLTDILDIFSQLLSGLSAAHSAGIIHRDIKPENLMIRDDGYLKILDFGVAKLKGQRKAQEAGRNSDPGFRNITDDGLVLGTASYMSPEQARGAEVDERSDIWSAGIVMFELITGTNPFAGDTPADTIAAILHKELPPITGLERNVPPELEEVVQKALRKDVGDRFQSAREFETALEAIRHKIEFEEELERSGIPNRLRRNTKTVERDTGESAVGRTTDRFDRIFNGLRSGKFAAFVIPALLIGMMAASYFVFRDTSPALTDKDVILLTDFENHTGEEVFDRALKQGLLFQLRQSPFLSIYPDSGVRETLALMKREQETNIDRELAREICQRRGLKAFLVGTISKFGSDYVVGIEGVNASTGAIVAVSQAEAETKEDVLGALSSAATEMRLQLGESLSTIREFDDPLPEVTTSSLEALKAYAMGVENLSEKEEARALFQQAIDLDPEFAAAYMRLGDAYDQTRLDLQKAAFRKAYELRDKISERERIAIQEIYYHLLDPDLDKMIEFLKASKVKYPRDAGIWTGLARGHYLQRKFEEAAREAEEALKIEPGAQFALGYLSRSLLELNRIEEAKNAILKYRTKPDEQAEKLFDIAFFQNDEKGMKAQLEILRKNGDADAIRFEAEAFAARGEWRRSKALAAPVVSKVKEIDSKEFLVFQRQVFLAAQLGMCGEARKLSGRMLSFPKDQLNAGIMRTFTRMMARCGDISRARELYRTLDELYPKFRDKAVTDALLEAEIDLWRGDARAALEHLETLDNKVFRKYELRARAFLMLNWNDKALADYQHILNNPGQLLCSPLYPLAQLGKARATKDKVEYEKFFEMWMYADDDIPELVAARKEYRELNSRTTESARDEATPSQSASPPPPWSWIF